MEILIILFIVLLSLQITLQLNAVIKELKAEFFKLIISQNKFILGEFSKKHLKKEGNEKTREQILNLIKEKKWRI